jgi:hypothetical protein
LKNTKFICNSFILILIGNLATPLDDEFKIE